MCQISARQQTRYRRHADACPLLLCPRQFERRNWDAQQLLAPGCAPSRKPSWMHRMLFSCALRQNPGICCRAAAVSADPVTPLALLTTLRACMLQRGCP